MAKIIETFTTVGSTDWTVPAGVTKVDILIVAGGGSGGGGNVGAGGGAGGFIYETDVSVTPDDVNPIVVGGGGAGRSNNVGYNGGNSSALSMTAIGGGGGGGGSWNNWTNPNSGGSGGGGQGSNTGYPAGANGTTDQGKAGGAGRGTTNTNYRCGGGGGGAGEVGFPATTQPRAGFGGDGLQCDISGSNVYYAGGGGGGINNLGTYSGDGGAGGGGEGSGWSEAATAGTNGKGGGGGGAQEDIPTSGAGGSGIVILSYEYKLDCVVGSYSITGSDVDFNPMPCESGSYGITGTDASLEPPLIAETGSYSISGQNANLDPHGIGITFVGSSTGGDSSGGHTLTLPTGLQEGDLVLILNCATSVSNYFTGIQTFGWTHLEEHWMNATGDNNSAIAFKIMGAVPDTSVWIRTQPYGSASLAYAFRGVDPDIPLDVDRVTASGGGSTPNCPSITPVTEGAVVVACGLASGSWDTSITPPIGYSNLKSHGSSSYFKVTIAAATKLWDGEGAEDPSIWTNWTGSSGAWFAATLALRPKAANRQLITRVGTAYNYTTGSSVNITLPTNMQEDDVVVIQLGQTTVVSWDRTLGVTGYTKIVEKWADSTYEANSAMFYKRMGATPDTIATCTTNGAATHLIGIATVYRGVSGNTVLDVAATSNVGWSSPNPSPITPITQGALIVIGASGAYGSLITTPPAGYGGYGVSHAVNNGSPQTTTGMASKYWDGDGEENPGAWKYWETQYGNGAITIALRPELILSANNGEYTIDGKTANLVDETDAIAATDGVYSISGVGLAKFVIAETGSFIISGTAAELLAPIVAEFGTYAITGQAATLYAVYPGDVGAYTITGKSAFLFIPFIADPGTYSITGTDANLEYQVVFQGGAYSITGKSAELSNVLKVLAASGSYSISGTDANIWANSVPLDSVVYVINGSAAQLFSTVKAGAGTYVITGKPADISPVFRSNAGEYIISGNSVFIFPSFNVPTGAYSITGKDAILTLEYYIGADIGEYVITGTDVFLWENKFICDPGQYLLTGTELPATVIAEKTEYVITGTAADIIQSDKLYPDIGEYILTGFDATLWRNTLYPESGEYTLTMGTLDYGVSLPADAEQYVISGTDAGLAKVLVLPVEAGGYLINGIEAILIIGHNNFPVENGQYSMGGVNLNDGLDANTTTYDITGIAADLDKIEDALVVYSGSYLMRGAQVKSLPRPLRQWIQM